MLFQGIFSEQHLWKLLASFLAVDSRPISTVESQRFRRFVWYMKPNLKIPGRQTMRGLIIQEFDTEQKRMIKFFHSQPELKVRTLELLTQTN
jgi:hypothetical protein